MIGYLLYFFAFLSSCFALFTIMARNPVTSVLNLVATFISVASIFILLNAEFIAMVVAIVYVGAVCVFFLFVIMMTHQTLSQFKLGFSIIPIIISSLMFIFDMYVMFSSESFLASKHDPVLNFELTNAELIGHYLYTEYFYSFQITALILLAAMIGAIPLTIQASPKFVRKQSYLKQVILRSSNLKG